jgi:FSR family fosmidomycin resistance protein-like MFS transporter
MSIGDYARGMGLLMRNMPAMFICLVSAMRTMAQSGLVVFVPLYMVNEIGTNAAVAGSALLLMQVAGGVATPVAGYMSDRIGPRPVMFACLSATSIVILGATFVSDATVYIGCIAVVGFVLFAVRPVLQAWIVEVVPDDFRGSATAVMFGVQALGNMTIPLVGGWIADNYGILNVFYVLAAIMLVANVVTFMLPKHKGRATRES